MMNKKQIQLLICKGMANGDSRLCKAKYGDNEVMISTDGCSAFILFENECIFDLNKIPTKKELIRTVDIKEFEEIKITNRRFVERGLNIVEFKGATKTIYALDKFVKMFDGNQFYTDGCFVVVKDDWGATIGMFCPMRFKEEGEPDAR